jgi:multidrug efflux pump subunit AcrB
VPGVDFEESQLMSDLLGDLISVPQPIEIKLAGDPAKLDATAKKVARAIGKVRGVVGVKSGVVIAGNSIEIHVDPAKAAMYGLDPMQLEQTVSSALRGKVVTALPGQERFTGVRLELPRDAFARTGDLLHMPIATPSGALVPLGAFATVRTVTGKPEIDRENLQRIAAVTGRITGRGFSSTVADVKQVLAKPGMLPQGMRYTLGGLYKQQQKSFRALAAVFVAAVIAEFILLLFLYRSFLTSAAIVITALFASLAVFIGLAVSGVTLNITALMGMTMIVGLTTEMAIFYVSEYQSLAEHDDPRDSLVTASRNRLRPIAMTTLAAILTLLPLALGIGEGSGMQQPLAIAVISGFLVAFPIVLFALPVMLRVVVPKR